jgi:hypothetical protein
MLNISLLRSVFKRQKNVKTSAFGSELVATTIATELIMEIHFMLRSLGV